MNLVRRHTYLSDANIFSFTGDKSPSVRSTHSYHVKSKAQLHSSTLSLSPSNFDMKLHVRARRSLDLPVDTSEGEYDCDDDLMVKENYSFVPKIIRKNQSKRGSFKSIRNQQKYPTSSSKQHSSLLYIQAPQSKSIALSTQQNSLSYNLQPSFIDNKTVTVTRNSTKEIRGQTLLHLAARLGHDEIMRCLIGETSQASVLINAKDQTPLLVAIEHSATSTAILLMESDPRSIVVRDINGSNVFHYACDHCNDFVLHRAIGLLKRLNSTSDRISALCRITERNRDGKTPFDIAIEKGQLKCVKHIVLSSWLEANIDMRALIDATSMKKAIDNDQIDILTFFVSETKRFAYIIHLLIDVNGQYFNLLEYAILLKKKDIVRLFVSVRIPIEHYNFRHEYKQFLKHYNVPFVETNGLSFCQTPIQRMLTTPECVPLVPLILEQFVSSNGIDLSIVDDCLYAQPMKTRCIFGRAKHFSTDHWHQQHPLTLIAKADCKDVYDHRLVRLCVDLKFHLFGNFLYFLILCCQSMYVALYTGIALGSPTPADQNTNYYELVNYTCFDLCIKLANDQQNPATDHSTIRALRFILLIVSVLALLKELFQILTQREKYFRRFYINLIELHMYVSAIIYSVDVNECTRQTGIRCSTQWMTGGIGLLSVWTSLLLVVMNGIKFGKHGLLFMTVYVTFLKFIAVYFMIWIGYILAFYMLCKDFMEQFRFFNFLPKLLVMFVGEYDMGSTFFQNNKLMPGSEGALILYSAYIFTMFIVMMNIMGGLAVADVKEYRLNAKREHLRARIGVVLGFQARLGRCCETIASIMRALSSNVRFMMFWNRLSLIPMKYNLHQLEIRSYRTRLPYNTNVFPSVLSSFPLVNHESVDHVQTEPGYYYYGNTIRNDKLFMEEEHTRLLRKTDDLRDTIEESSIRTHNEMRKIALSLQNELEDIKRRLIQQ